MSAALVGVLLALAALVAVLALVPPGPWSRPGLP